MYGPAAGHFDGINDPHVVLIVFCKGMVSLVHKDRALVVVDGDIHWMPGRHLDPGRGPAATGEIIHNHRFK